jgi:hypothetical protein
MEEITNNVVMIDLDGVVLDKKYQTTEDISRSTQRAAERLLLVPNSDTTVPRQSIGRYLH